MDPAEAGNAVRRRAVRVILGVVLLLLVVLSLVILYLITSRDAVEPPRGTADPTTAAPSAGVLVIEQYAGAPEGAGAGDVGAIVRTDDGTIHVFTTGSSSCPEIPTKVVVDGDEIVVTVGADFSGACTADLVPTTSVIAIPAEYQGVEPPSVHVERVSR